MSASKVAVVTGANKGVGYGIVEGLCKKFDGTIYLTARSENRGKAALAKLKELGFSPLFHQLDITDQESVDRFKEYIKSRHDGLDLLVNNAAIKYIHQLDTEHNSSANATELAVEEAEKTLEVNYYGTLRVCQALFPLLRNNARVVNISSASGRLCNIPSADLKAKFNDPNLTFEGVNKLMEKFIKDTKENRAEQEGWGTAYIASKVGLTALTFIQQRIFDKEVPNRNISINAVHPGFVDTDMSEHKGNLTVEQGARAPLYTALEANLKGKYIWFDSKVVDWAASPSP
ncbi:hypothetical protein NQ318_014442 [Aromia moschata]|uniref:carbonyl reductase (NADPH) n=1 Tax=Aromia moschata TaxID=1265417 RepID=A0AAV8Y4U6_9CUCU|nr:hypothetical protein NQ318_014442 [Aromia moschata]